MIKRGDIYFFPGAEEMFVILDQPEEFRRALKREGYIYCLHIDTRSATAMYVKIRKEWIKGAVTVKSR